MVKNLKKFIKNKERHFALGLAIILAGLVLWLVFGTSYIFNAGGVGKGGFSGQKPSALPDIPGVSLLSENKGACFHESKYAHALPPQKNALKEAGEFIKRSFAAGKWELKSDNTYEDGSRKFVLVGETGEKKEAMEITVKPRGGEEALYIFKYYWPPCSEDL